MSPDPNAPPPEGAASAERISTGDPDLFLIPEEALPAGFADRVESEGWEPAPALPAATVVLLREGSAAPEALLLRRHRRSGFAADAWVFPGGRVDAGDRDPALASLLDGPSPEEWAERLSIVDPAEALSYVGAAIREAWEETGIVLSPAGAGAGAGAVRRALLADEVTLAEASRREGVRYDTGELLYIAHWITPEPEPRRFDTRFFLARAPKGAACDPHQAEITDFRWISAAAAVAGFEAGSLRLLPPTVHTLRRLAGVRSLDEVWEALRRAPVPAILPRMRRHPQGVAIELPRG